MKISVLSSTLSCISKCIRFSLVMINKKIILGLFIVSFVGACASPTAMLGPAYTFSSSGNILQAGFTYGTNQVITKSTGKTPFENLKEIKPAKQNIKKQTLESQDFYILVKNKIEKTKGVLKLSNQ